MIKNHDAGLFNNFSKFEEHAHPDLQIKDGDLRPETGLETAILLSLFSDRRATVEQLPDLEESKRGWWADDVSDPIEDKWGSLLWIVERAKITNDLTARIEDFVRESLDWMIIDGVAERINVNAVRNGLDRIDISIEIFDFESENFQFSFAWQGQETKTELQSIE